mmetsp:Transcript_604/g.1950  ORF Transcript_604/g.1950 Transcript_604/m.1950 type:complete len:525 (+) Transcript_604:42-1616(+)
MIRTARDDRARRASMLSARRVASDVDQTLFRLRGVDPLRGWDLRLQGRHVRLRVRDLLHLEPVPDVDRIHRRVRRRSLDVHLLDLRLLLVQPAELAEHAAEHLGVLLRLRMLRAFDLREQVAGFLVPLVVLDELLHVSLGFVVLLELRRRLRAAVQRLLVPALDVERLARSLARLGVFLVLDGDRGGVQVNRQLQLLAGFLLVVGELRVVLHVPHSFVVLLERELELPALVRVVPRAFHFLARLELLRRGHLVRLFFLLKRRERDVVDDVRVRRDDALGQRRAVATVRERGGDLHLRDFALLHAHDRLLEPRGHGFVPGFKGEFALRIHERVLPVVERDGVRDRDARAIVRLLVPLALRRRFLRPRAAADRLDGDDFVQGHGHVRALRVARQPGAVLPSSRDVLHLVNPGVALLNLREQSAHAVERRVLDHKLRLRGRNDRVAAADDVRIRRRDGVRHLHLVPLLRERVPVRFLQRLREDDPAVLVQVVIVRPREELDLELERAVRGDRGRGPGGAVGVLGRAR